jgi:hypothetical protein
MAPLGVTMADLVERTRNHLVSNRRTPLNRLEDDLDLGAEFLELKHDSSQVRDAAYLGIDYEVVYGWATAGKRVDIARGQLGTADAFHNEGTIVEVEPRFPRGVILRALQEELRSWPEDVFRVEVVAGVVGLDDDAVVVGVTGTAPVHRLLAVQFAPDVHGEGWTNYLGGRLVRTGGAYQLSFYGGRPMRASALRVVVARGFNLTTLLPTTDLGDVGLTHTMLDIPALGAAARLVVPTEIERTDDYPAGSGRTAEMVQGGARLRAGATLWQLRNDRLEDERRRLLAEYGFGLALA